MKFRSLLLVFTLLILPLSPAPGQDWKEVSEAYERGAYATVIELLRPFAEQGDAEAQGELGFMYVKGKGVLQDYVLAYAWLNLAEMSDDDEVEWTKKIQWLMTAEQIARAREMSTNLFNRISPPLAK